jgi:hypothetical protein
MAETLRGHARLGISEVQVALTRPARGGVHAFAPVIEELRGEGRLLRRQRLFDHVLVAVVDPLS